MAKGKAGAGQARAPSPKGIGSPTTPAATAAAARRTIARAEGVAAPERTADAKPRPDYPRYRIDPGEGFRMRDYDPDATEDYRKKRDVEDELASQRERIRSLQERLYAEHKRSLLVVLQAMDTGGKDGTIRSVFEGVNPQGCQVWSFKRPSEEELSHDFLWRYHAKAPPRGMVTIFNRSHYEDVLIVRVKSIVPEEVWRQRYAMINHFEQLLTLDGTTILKFFLHISKEEQKERLESRLRDPTKHWKWDGGDLRERAYWDQYMLAYEDAITNCATAHAPWYVVPANKKWYRNLVIARAIADTLEAMNPQYPPAPEGLEGIVVPD